MRLGAVSSKDLGAGGRHFFKTSFVWLSPLGRTWVAAGGIGALHAINN